MKIKKICKVKECKKPYFALGYCQVHYIHFKKYGDPLKYSDKFLPKFCKIPGCNKKHNAKGYCRNHYGQIVLKDYLKKYRAGILPNQKKCKIKDCQRGKFSLGYCHKHWRNFKETGNPLGITHKCIIKGCSLRTRKKYCIRHLQRIKRGLPLDLTKKYEPRGERNFQWKGGIAEYPNHYEMKKNRLLKIQQTKGKCEGCGKEGTYIHHKDSSKNNHSLNNLLLLCGKCHGLIHKGRSNKTSKYIRLYGATLQDLCDKLNCSQFTVYNLHRRGTLKNILTTQKSHSKIKGKSGASR